MKSAVKQGRAAEYASAEDFCRIFKEESQSLYLLALMLTADHQKAESTVVEALADSQKSVVFKPWVKSWSRLAVIERAIKTSMPKDASGYEVQFDFDAMVPPELGVELEAVLRMDVFHRFVYVLTVLESYSVSDCAILLKRGKRDAAAARLRAMNAVAAQQAATVIPMDNHLPATLSA